MSIRTRLARWAWLAFLPLALLAGRVRADHASASLDVRALADGLPLVEGTYVREDRGGALSLQDVMRDPGSFARAQRESSFGFTSSAVWTRFSVHNRGATMQPWLLELAYSHLDVIDLYAVRDGSLVRHWHAGDRLPFSQREVRVPTFVFPQEAPPGRGTTYYLRVETTGSLRIPLRAWRALDFVAHQNEQNLFLWLFYGVVAAMTLYNVGTAALLRKREYSLYVGVLISLGGSIFTLSGQTFQYLLPNSPMLANRTLAVFMALGLVCVQLYAVELIRQDALRDEFHTVSQIFKWTLPPSFVAFGVALFASHAVAQLAVFCAILAYVPLGIYQLWLVHRKGMAQFRFFLLSFGCLAVTIPVALLAHVKLIPPWPPFIWAGHIGCASYSILTSLSLPARINEMGRRLEALNAQLSNNVGDLKLALARAERATAVKDEFMATMSHELRTPLNAIINVPQGLLEDFPSEGSAQCEACSANFLLERDERVSVDTACPKCGRVGSLLEGEAIVYVGKPARTAHFLRKIERSGHHLLQMVNGVLDFSKMEAGRLELVREAVDLHMLISEVVDQVSELCTAKLIMVELKLLESGEPCFVDAMRIRQVLLNLLTNAIKFSENGSKIVVSWQRSAEADTLDVTDQGIGIAPEDHERVFASFEQVHKGDTRKYGGTGLGLSIARSLVRMHGGELWVESQLGAGASFRFTLPRSSSQLGSRPRMSAVA